MVVVVSFTPYKAKALIFLRVTSNLNGMPEYFDKCGFVFFALCRRCKEKLFLRK